MAHRPDSSLTMLSFSGVDERLDAPDLTSLSQLTEEVITTCLENRFDKKEIYTYIGSILISVNPYKPTRLYTQEMMNRYYGKTLGTLPPHLFALADTIYKNLIETKKNQSVVISGESGSGKTETTKYLLGYFCHVCGTASTAMMPDQIMAANVIMEAFGNAKTVRNDNSSRFGKFIRVCMKFPSGSDYPVITGAFIEDYLLEQSRIIRPSADERNYHVFYQFLGAAAADPNQRYHKQHFARAPSTFRYLSSSDCYTVDGQNELDMFDKLITAFGQINVDPDKFEGILDVLSAVLWFGNVDFTNEESEDVVIAERSVDIIEILVGLLGMKDAAKLDQFEQLLLFRKNFIRGEQFMTPFKLTEAIENRDAMAKALYSQLFSWIIEKVRECTNPSDSGAGHYIGILDIFGFECLPHNSFEQLCINYANEKLHMFFNHYIFKIEQELYSSENITVDQISFSDNQGCLDVLEKAATCVLKVCAEECRFPDGTDESYVLKQHKALEGHSHYIKGADRRYWKEQFGIRHYAGEVTYKVKGFLDKNRDAQQDGFFELLAQSSNDMIREVADRFFSEQGDHAGIDVSRRNRGSTLRVGKQAMGGSHRQSVGERFRTQLKSLVKVLDSTNSWYIRCLKPNEHKAPFQFDRDLVQNQLRYLGMMDIIRIKREGFPVHVTPVDFLEYYWYLVKDKKTLHDGTPATSVIKDIMHTYRVCEADWQIGTTQIFLKSNVADMLVELKARLVVKNVTVIQKYVRGFTKWHLYQRKRSAAIRLQYFARKVIKESRDRRRERAIVILQSFGRMILAKNRTRIIRYGYDSVKKQAEERARQEAEAAEAARIAEEERLLEQQRAAESKAAESEAAVAPVPEARPARPLSTQPPPPVAPKPRLSKMESRPEPEPEQAPIIQPPAQVEKPEKSLEEMMAELDDFALDLGDLSALEPAPKPNPKPRQLPRKTSSLNKSLGEMFKRQTSQLSPDERDNVSTPGSHDGNLEQMISQLETKLTARVPQVPDDDDLDAELAELERSQSKSETKPKSLTEITKGQKLVRQSTVMRPEDLVVPDISALCDDEEAAPPVKPGDSISVDLDSGYGSTVTINSAKHEPVVPPKPTPVLVSSPSDKTTRYDLREYAENHFADLEYSDAPKSLAGAFSKAFGKKKTKAKIIPKEKLFDFSPDEFIPRPFHNLDSEELIENACIIYKELYKILRAGAQNLSKSAIQNVIGTLIKLPALRDEAIAYLIRFTDRLSPQNPEGQVDCAFRLLSVVLGVVMPSKTFMKYVKQYVSDLQKEVSFDQNLDPRTKQEKMRMTSHLMRLLNCVKIGERKCPPSGIEIKGSLTFRVIKASLHTTDRSLDGGFLSYDTTVDALGKCRELPGNPKSGEAVKPLIENTSGWALFETSPALGDVYVKAQTCLADYLYKWEVEEENSKKKIKDDQRPKFIFLKRVFKEIEKMNETSTELTLVFLQCVRSVVEKDEFKVTEKEALELAGLQCSGTFGPYDDSQRLTRYQHAEKFIPMRILRHIPDKTRDLMLMNQHKKNPHLTASKGKLSYILKCLNTLPLFGSAIYEDVSYRGFVNSDRMVTLAVNRHGISLLLPGTTDLFLSYTYDQMHSIAARVDADLILIKLDAASNTDEMLCELMSEYKEDIVHVIKCYCPRLVSAASDKSKDVLGGKAQNEEKSVKRMRMDVRDTRSKLIAEDPPVLNHAHANSAIDPSATISRYATIKKKKNDESDSNARLEVDSPYWIFTKRPLSEPLLAHDEENEKGVALKMFSTLLLFSKHISEKHASALPGCERKDPINIIQEILKCCSKNPDMIDELYLQLCKQVTEQPLDSKDLDVWQIFGALVNYVVPTNHLVRGYVEATLRLLSIGVSKVSECASYCRRCMQKVSTFPARKKVPSTVEIACTSKCEQVKTDIQFAGRQSRTVQFDSWATCQQVVQATIDRIYLAGVFRITEYALYEMFSNESGLVKEAYIEPSENICDLLARHEATGSTGFVHQLLFKRMLFTNAREPIATNLEVALLYQQALDEIKTVSFRLSTVEAVHLLAHVVKLEHNMRVAELEKSGKALPPNYQQIEPRLVQDLVKRILPENRYPGISLEDIQNLAEQIQSVSLGTIVSRMQKFRDWGTAIFFVDQMFASQMNKQLLLAVNEEGLRLYNRDDCGESPALKTVRMCDIEEVSTQNNSIQVKAWEPNMDREYDEPKLYLFYTGRMNDIATLVNGYRKIQSAESKTGRSSQAPNVAPTIKVLPTTTTV